MVDFTEMKPEASLGYRAYRYVDRFYATGSEEYGYHTEMRVELLEFDVVKETLHGFWINPYPYLYQPKRFVRINARRQYACLSKSDALESYKRRKKQQVRILESQLAFAKQGLAMAEGGRI